MAIIHKLNVICNFGGQNAPFTIYVGEPNPKNHPIHFQAEWLSKERGGTVPADVMESLTSLKNLSETNGVPLPELVEYAFKEAGSVEQNNNSDAIPNKSTDIQKS